MTFPIDVVFLKSFLFLFGLIIGSFLTALTYRIPKRLSISKGRSICPNCKKQISWYDNIPLLSFILLMGKCRNCKKRISLRYPIIELATAITFVIIGFNVFNLILASILISIFVIDWEHQIIPDEFVFGGLVVLVFILLIANSELLFSNLLAGFLSALILLFLNLVTKGKGMGLGDVKLALLLGGIVGINLFWIWLFFSFVVGASIGIILMGIKKATLREKIAFGPFLIIGLVLAILFGQSFLLLLGI